MTDKIISKGRVSATRGAAILGVNPYMTAFAAWQDIMEKRQPGFNAAHGYDYEEFEGNVSTRWGKAFEDAVIKLSEEKAGSTIENREYHAFHSEYDYIHCYLDGMYHRHTPLDRFILHEGKTTTLFNFGDNWGEPGSDKVPTETQIQVQHQMLCTGADECIVSVLVFPKRPEDWEEMGLSVDYFKHLDSMYDGYEIIKRAEDDIEVYDYVATPLEWAEPLAQMGFFHQYTVKANPGLQAKMLDKYRVWWTKYVLGEKPPAPANYSDIRAMITAPSGTIIVDPDTARWFKERREINAEIGSTSNLAKRAEQLKTLILKRGYVREHEMCPYDRTLEYKTCHGECGQSECSIGSGRPVLDDESADKWIFRDDQGKKLGSYGKNKSGNMVFR